MSTHSKNNSGKRGITVLGKRFFLVIGILALVVFFIALGAAFIPQGGHENKPSAVTLFGTGTVSDPYQIGSVEDLAELADDVNINGNFHTGDWFILTADLDLNVSPYNDTGWTPIGHDDTNSSRFEGNFNGNGHTISNLYINDTSNDNIGLFGLVWNGTIENLGVLNADVTGDVVVGGAVGSAYYSTIENCYVTGKVTGEGSVGGVVGTGLMSTIKNCYNAGAVTGDGDCVGGILGVNSGVVENCYNIGDVYGGNVSVGGVVGYNDSNSIVDNCYNIGDVAGKGQSEGGVAGTNYGTIDYCYNTGAVNVNYGSYAGGVVADNFGTVENSYNVGAVYCVGNDVGGAVGWNETDGTIEKCFNTGDVRCSGSEVGGVAGFNDGTVQKCYNTCNVTTIGSRSDVGGVVGGNRGMVENCYNKGDIPNTGTYVGGVAGYNGSGGTIGNCYNIGAVNGDGSNVGGVVGSNSGFGTVENCFFKRESGVFNSSLHGIGNTGSDTGAEPTSDADMQKMSTFTTGTGLTNGSWDIDSIGGSSPVWFMLDSETYPNPTYPMLFWQIADSGSGTETDQYVITTVQQLENIQNVFVMHKESSGVYWQLGKDIDLTGYLAEGGPGYNGGFGWVPIGSSNTYSFIGNFDGSGHTITGLFINSGYYYVGPFGYVYSGCEIMNLGVVNANITGGFYVGGVVGYNNGGTVESCYVTGTVYGSGSDVGGIAGYASGTEENCYNTSTVTGRGNAVGGVAGY
ncbi:MAG: hypothetical protein FWF07_00005, partial [Methanomassiliicoccaceae archaeon]|nr:hypothetical protein [Methanomassiliicoccaceae archaeon]